MTGDEVRERVTVTAKACNVPEILTPYTAQEKRQAKKANKELNDRYTSNNKIMKLVKDIYQMKPAKKQVDDKRVKAHDFIGFIELKLADFEPVPPMIQEAPESKPVAHVAPIPTPKPVGEIEPRVYEALKRLYDSGWIDHKRFMAQIEQAKYVDEFNASW